MSTINAQQLSMAYALRGKSKTAVDITVDGSMSDTKAATTTQSNLTDGDTVELSKAGQKALNLSTSA